jgi:AcrR family transcriptional regulator
MTAPRGIATRERILAAAAQVLSSKGYAGARQAEIAKVAGVHAPAVYYYFDSHEALISEVMAVGQSRLREHVQQALAALADDTDPMERICHAVAAHLEVALDLSPFATAVTRNLGQLPDSIRQRLRDESGAYVELWRNLLSDAKAAGLLCDGIDPRAARMLLMGALNAAPEWFNPGQGSLADLIHTAQTLVRNGLAATG